MTSLRINIPTTLALSKNTCLGTLMSLSLLMCTPAHGLSVVPRTFDELVQLADLVMVGTVKDIQSEFADNGLDQNTIFSFVRFSNLQIVKGQLASTEYELRMPGGVVGRFAQDYPGTPEFQIGQRYLVFIRGNDQDFFPLVGITQGTFRVLTNAQGKAVVIRDDQLNLTSQHALTSLTQNAPTLDKFISDIHSRLIQGTLP